MPWVPLERPIPLIMLEWYLTGFHHWYGKGDAEWAQRSRDAVVRTLDQMISKMKQQEGKPSDQLSLPLR